MEQMRMTQQLVDMQKSVFEHMVNSMIMFWDQTEKMVGPLVDQAVWIPPERKGVFKQLVEQNKRGCEYIKSAAEQGFDWLEVFFNGNASK